MPSEYRAFMAWEGQPCRIYLNIFTYSLSNTIFVWLNFSSIPIRCNRNIWISKKKPSQLESDTRGLKALNSITGAPLNRKNVKLVCVVECDPLCDITWFRNGLPILANSNNDDNAIVNNDNADVHNRAEVSGLNSYYTVSTHARPPKPAANLLLHVESVLELDFAAKRKMAARLSANYSCAASANEVGEAVESATLFRVHYPPKNITTSPK